MSAAYSKYKWFGRISILNVYFVPALILVLSDNYISSDEETTTNQTQKPESEIPE